jgi:hypothetical protein
MVPTAQSFDRTTPRASSSSFVTEDEIKFFSDGADEPGEDSQPFTLLVVAGGRNEPLRNFGIGSSSGVTGTGRPGPWPGFQGDPTWLLNPPSSKAFGAVICRALQKLSTSAQALLCDRGADLPDRSCRGRGRRATIADHRSRRGGRRWSS